ncbi:hypothetical protein I6F34_01180 [Bradyrhizobium sp. BRP05]|nr:hypothetical protein [Bradyrhizobium sp. BRP05]
MQIHLLDDPVGYVTGIIENFVDYRYDPESSKVRLGRTGTGKAPNYKIEKPSYRHALTVGDLTFEMTATPANTFSGRTHREMVELDDCPWHDKNWSTDTFTFVELKFLLSRLSQNTNIH